MANKQAISNQNGQPEGRNYWNLFNECFNMLFFTFLSVRGIYASLVPSYAAHPYLPIYLGSVFQIMNAQPLHMEFLYFLWSSNYLAYFTLTKYITHKQIKFVQIVQLLKGRFAAKHLGLNRVEADIIEKRVQKMSHSIRKATRYLSTMTTSVFVVMFYLKYRGQHLLPGLIWLGLHIRFALVLFSGLFRTDSYLALICILVRLKFRRIIQHLTIVNNQIGYYRQNADSRIRSARQLNQWYSLTADILLIFRSISEIMVEHRQYNHFWKHLFTIVLVWRLWIMSFVLYLITFYPFHLPVRIGYVMLLSAEIISLHTTMLHGASIPSDGQIVAKRLRGLLYCNWTKSVLIRLKTQKQLELFTHEHGISFQFTNDVALKKIIIFYIAREFSTYFMLLASMSSRYRSS